jgi:hypothetical protein
MRLQVTFGIHFFAISLTHGQRPRHRGERHHAVDIRAARHVSAGERHSGCVWMNCRSLTFLQYKKPEGAPKIETKASADVLATMTHAPRDFMKSNRSKIAQQSAANGVKDN